MLLKKTIGILIIIFNIGGIWFILFVIGKILKDKFFFWQEQVDDTQASREHKTDQKTAPKISNEDIIPDEDDLLKDMDLSDLDNLNFDDFD